MNKKRLGVLALVFTLLSSVLVFTLPEAASAVTGSDWRPGRIVDDAVFTDNKSMTVEQIQSFLDSKLTSCDVHGTGSVSYNYQDRSVTSTRALYSYRRGNGAVTAVKPDNIPDADNAWYTDNTWFRCLNEYWENPSNGQNNYANRPRPAGSISSAQMIWQAAQNQRISPKTLIITLQKEQGLITDGWPFQTQYTHALGAYCPDTAPCDPAHEGFSKQMNDGAELFRYYLDNMSQAWWSYKKPGNNSILYNPSSNCGASNVYVEDKATAALYTYTPYQPNRGALDNLYGESPSCGAYGNRNFWRTFHDWFGTPYTDGYVAQFNAQNPTIDGLYPGIQKTAYLQYKNNGSSRWFDDTSVPAGISPVHLAASTPTNRSSVFSYGWPSGGRPNFTFTKVFESDGTTLAANQHIVEPGQIARFDFTITAPWTISPGTRREYFQPVLEGAQDWGMGGVAWLDITVQTRYISTFSSSSPTSTIQHNTAEASFFSFKNSGTAAWYDDTTVPTGYFPTHLATASPNNSRWSGFGASWPSRTRPGMTFTKVYEADGTTIASNQHIVMPGQIARFDFTMSAPESIPSGFYREYFQLIHEGAPYPYMGDPAWFDITVKDSAKVAQYAGQSAFPTMKAGASVPSYLHYKNVGSVRWYDSTSVPAGLNPVHFAASNPTNRSSVFSYGWPSGGRPNFTFTKVFEADAVTLATNQHIVEPGQIARFEFNMTAPWTITPGIRREYFQPVIEGAQYWGMGAISWLDVNIIP